MNRRVAGAQVFKSTSASSREDQQVAGLGAEQPGLNYTPVWDADAAPQHWSFLSFCFFCVTDVP